MSGSDQPPPPYPTEDTGWFDNVPQSQDTGAGGDVWKVPPPPYAETDPSQNRPQEVMIACGGWDGEQALNTVEMFDPNKGEWSQLPNMLAPRRDHGAAVMGDYLYVVGGWNMEPYYSQVDKFNIKTKTWSPTAPLSGPRGWPGVTALGEYVYCVGGYDAKDRAVKLVERFHVREERWESVKELNKARGGCGLVEYNGCLFAIGGFDGDKALKSVEKFDPKEGKWRKVADMNSRREDLSHACVLYNNNIVVMGGVDDNDTVLATGAMYSPDTNKWRPMQASLIREKRGVSLAVVGGVMFAAGGEDRNDQNLEMVMMFDLKSQSWQQWHNMRGGRAGHAVGVIMKDPFPVGGFAF
eukprot:GFUD01019440.1.p1 GENE.GFUD01019440.1~~GFUD01019440.1.p1  ORF type:complete len:353 (+),score=129.81 GFUD01019440.1:92-1150(+)